MGETTTTRETMIRSHKSCDARGVTSRDCPRDVTTGSTSSTERLSSFSTVPFPRCCDTADAPIAADVAA